MQAHGAYRSDDRPEKECTQRLVDQSASGRLRRGGPTLLSWMMDLDLHRCRGVQRLPGRMHVRVYRGRPGDMGVRQIGFAPTGLEQRCNDVGQP